jgi:signal transduction histidine kinase
MVLAFGPLFYAVVTYTSYALREERQATAGVLGRVVAHELASAETASAQRERLAHLNALIAPRRVEAVGLYDGSGRLITRLGQPEAADTLPTTTEPRPPGVSETTMAGLGNVAVMVPESGHTVVAVLGPQGQGDRTASLARLVALYTALMALALLIAAYFALTALIVKPLDALGRAAERVAGGLRRLEVPRAGARELAELGASLGVMTDRLLANEDAVREQIAEVRRTTERLKEAQARLVRSERLASVGRLAAGLAHEIGNPLSSLLAMEDLLLEGDLKPGEARDFLLRMRQETERIHAILRDLLAFARPSAEERGPAAEPGSMATAIQDTLALLAPQRALRDVSLDLQVDPELPHVTMSRDQLVQVLLNLLLNAADACGEGGHVLVRACRMEHGVQVAVQDDGPGVSKSIRPRLFEPFLTTKEVGKGTGLGLAVCRGLVEAAGGTVSLDEGFVEGARFVLELPEAEVSN